jgi:carboxymethylenebutenolidase
MRWKSILACAWLLCALPMSASAIEGRKITLPASERQVAVTYFRAPGDGKRPAALLLHGAGGFDAQIASYNQYASSLAENGIDAYLVYYYSTADDYGMHHGDDVFQRRYGDWAKLVDDLADGLIKSGDSNGKVGLVGFSNGALLATGASAKDAKIAAAVIYYGGMPWPGIGPVTRFPPLLILHGDADTVIPVMEGKFLADTAKQFGGPAELVIYPGERHGFGSRLTTQNGADGLKRTIAFLRKELDVK